MNKNKCTKIDISQYNFSVNISNAIKIAFISDLHEYKTDLFVEIVKQINPEIILFGGDIVHNQKYYENGIKLFNKATPLCPTLCCLGNHEQLFKEEILALMAKSGVTPLDNAAIQYNDINIGGLSSPQQEYNHTIKNSIPNIDWLREYEKIDGYRILLCHQPEYCDKYIRESNIDLILSGHAHGGQWRVGNKGLYAPGQGLFPKYSAGMYENKLVVTRGIGNSYIVPRINNNPEIVAITIVPNR